MKAVTIRVREIMPRGQVAVMADVSHPEVDVFTTIDNADALVIACHPDHEQVVRDAVAIEQERPRWWRELRRLEDFYAVLARGGDTMDPKTETQAEKMEDTRPEGHGFVDDQAGDGEALEQIESHDAASDEDCD